MGMDVRMAPIGFMNTATTRSTANGAVRRATATGAHTARTGCTGTVREVTSAFGAAPLPTAPDARIPQRAATRSERLTAVQCAW